MKKTLIALAAMATSAAFAQVTISGTWGVGYQSFTQKPSTAVTGIWALADGSTTNTKPASTVKGVTQLVAPVSTSQATNKGLVITDSDIKFSVAEDLGGGLKAGGNITISGNGSRGGNVTKGDSDLALMGGFGSLAIANTRASNTAIKANVFGSSTPRVNFYDTVDSRAAVDVISYTSPQLARGLTVSLTSAEATEGTDTSAVKVTIFGIQYASGPLAVWVDNKSYSPSTAGKNRTEMAVTYDLGVAKMGLGYGAANAAGADAVTSFGLNVPMGAISAGVNYAKRGTTDFTDLGMSYAMSKTASFNVMLSDVTGGTYAGNHYRVNLVKKF